MIKQPILQEDISILNGNTSTSRAAKHERRELTDPKEETDKSAVTDSSIPLSVI